MQITGYDYFTVGLSAPNNREQKFDNPVITKTALKNNYLIINFDNSHDLKIDLGNLVKDLKKMSNQTPQELAKKMILEAEDDKYKVKLFITSLSGEDQDVIIISSINFNLLMKRK